MNHNLNHLFRDRKRCSVNQSTLSHDNQLVSLVKLVTDQFNLILETSTQGYSDTFRLAVLVQKHVTIV